MQSEFQFIPKVFSGAEDTGCGADHLWLSMVTNEVFMEVALCTVSDTTRTHSYSIIELWYKKIIQFLTRLVLHRTRPLAP